ncbi:hypothetical protein P775_02775 [Puniceibacterium antarcticum]|uniref:Uncharacterized protein n=1 Tax=Puniceibacterium antarcticum TaxID=1206336 RepID=A0A2G8RJL1_9RHOB|nr:hypothetical protein P775_02775 [Puniceibacterium antarcticum]
MQNSPGKLTMPIEDCIDFVCPRFFATFDKTAAMRQGGKAFRLIVEGMSFLFSPADDAKRTGVILLQKGRPGSSFCGSYACLILQIALWNAREVVDTTDQQKCFWVWHRGRPMSQGACAARSEAKCAPAECPLAVMRSGLAPNVGASAVILPEAVRT